MRDQHAHGFAALRHALTEILGGYGLQPAYAGVPNLVGPGLLQVVHDEPRTRPHLVAAPGPRHGGSATAGPDAPHEPDHELAASSATDAAERERLIALVELAREGDKEAFGQLYDHYHVHVYRFLYYRLGSTQLAEDLTSETFFRALRSMSGFRWQGKDFGAWLTTIARNLTTDHYKSGRNRLEQTTEDLGTLDSTTEGPEHEVLAQLTNEALLGALRQLPQDQQDCLVLRFLQGQSLAETADALGRTPGAIKQLQLRAVRNLAKLLPEGVR